MVRVLYATMVVVSNKERVRFLCLSNKVKASSIEDKILAIKSEMSLDDIIDLFPENYLYFADYQVCEGDDFSYLEYSTTKYNLRVVRVPDKCKCLEMLHYNDYDLVDMDFDSIGNRLKYYSNSGWLFDYDIPLCVWKPIFEDGMDYSKHFLFKGSVVAYNYNKVIYLLTEESVRHKPFHIGESLTINIESMECIRSIKNIKDNKYVELTQIFNHVLKDWITVRVSTPIDVFGIKYK